MNTNWITCDACKDVDGDVSLCIEHTLERIDPPLPDIQYRFRYNTRPKMIGATTRSTVVEAQNFGEACDKVRAKIAAEGWDEAIITLNNVQTRPVGSTGNRGWRTF